MTWRPYTEPPQKVCDCEINDIFGHTHAVQWDGRHFRYADGRFAGGVMTHYRGDLWKSNETKETEMLSGIDIEDMRPDEPEKVAVPSPIRPVTPLTCPKCHALWLFWPKEQSGFDHDSLNMRSLKSCDYCEPASADQLESLNRIAPSATLQQAAVTARAIELIKERADDLESEVRARYQGYPEDDRRFLRDLIIVSEARGYLRAAEIADEVRSQSRNHLFRSAAKVIAGNIRKAATQPKEQS
ncbi:hypothetical protein CBM2637_A150011 [Cupriavidus taiwanensis]|uniref:hypothetical protein n=1 Tax=Cupriavidus taiwanensis TaxID=164546 RepID=UPI000E13C70A|nr:hypothetical protein [Cupriavidus taiwanensis]SPA24558.1 hypothetical protein CBM2637_A150011 [Cupriavidus taiwanensis]